MKIWALVLLSAYLLGPGLLSARGQAKPPASAKPDYSRESAVFDHLDRVFRYAADGTGSKDIAGDIEIRDQAAVKAFSVVPFDFASSAEHVEIDYVRVRRPDGTVIVTPATDAQELPAAVTREAPFYSDLKQEQVPIRSLREGDHLEYHISIVRTKPEAPGHFWGSDSFFKVSNGFVVLSESTELHIPKGVYAQVWSPKFQATQTTVADETIYRWQSAQPQPVAGKKPNELLRMENDPTLGTDDDPKLPDIAWTNFHTWAEVGAWYRSLEGSRTAPDDDTRARISTLTAGKITEEDKARAIYGYVGSQIRYIGVAFGIGRYQPHEAGDVLRNQYGDCKDKTTLLSSLLASAGVPADAVLIGAGVAFNEEVPSPGWFNHAINLAHVDGKPVWLDSTAEIAPYSFLLSPIRGKKALVIPLTGEAHFETTPKAPPFASEEYFDATGKLDDKGTSESHITIRMRGDEEIVFREAVRSVSPAQWDQLMQQVSQSFSYAGKVSNTKFSRPDDTAEPFVVDYDYEREKAGDWDTLRIVPQLAPVSLADADEKDPPVRPIELGTPQTLYSHAVMQLPKGWRADLPPAIHAKAYFATLDKTYKFEDGTLTVDRKIVVLAEKVPAADWKIYHQWYKDADLNGETYVQLTRSSTKGQSFPLHMDPLVDNADAADLVRQASEDEKVADWNSATGKLDQAKAKNPKQAFLWSNYGYIAAHNGKFSESIEDYKKELGEHPEEDYVASLLAFAQVVQKDYVSAMATLQTSIDRNPANEMNVLYLDSLYEMRGKYPEAEKVLRAATEAQPDNVNIKSRLGIVLLHNGKKDEGAKLFEQILNASDDPGQLNNAAYYLGNASLDLPLAEKASRRSLDLLDAASNKGETGPATLRRAELLVNAWDTLGWILYNEDKIAEAELWVRAAWRNGNSAEPGYHLAIILEKLHHPAEALTQIQLAAGVSRTASNEVKERIVAKQSAMFASLSDAQNKKSTINNTLDLQAARTYTLPRGSVRSNGEGWATVEVELTTQGNTAVRFIDGDETLRLLSVEIQRLDLKLQLPPESKATLIRRGVLSCHTAAICQLVLVSTVEAIRS